MEYQTRIMLLSRKRFQNLVNYAKSIKDPMERLTFLIDYFLNKTDESVAKQIDETNSFMPFEYDYSFLYLPGEERIARNRSCGSWLSSTSLADSISDPNVVQINNQGQKSFSHEYVSMFATKMGTCKMIANEFQRLMFYCFADDCQKPNQSNRANINNLCAIINKDAFCYDFYDSKSLKVNEVRLMNHYYNVVTIGGKKYKIDIAGALTMLDYAKNFGQKNPDLSSFICELKPQQQEKDITTFFEKIAKSNSQAPQKCN